MPSFLCPGLKAVTVFRCCDEGGYGHTECDQKHNDYKSQEDLGSSTGGAAAGHLSFCIVH